MEHITEAFNRFLSSRSSKVMAIRGAWGVGKTYFWNKYISNKKEAPEGINKYAYVSLFGVESIQQLSSSIIKNTETPWCTENGFLGTKKIPKYKPLSIALGIGGSDLPYVSNIKLFEDMILNSLIGKHLICFDDLERKSSLLPEAFLGLLSRLTLEKECKVVLIYNDEEVRDGSFTGAIARSRDKLIDVDLKFDPTVENNSSLIESPLFHDYAASLFKKSNIKNIRVMMRVVDALTYFNRYSEKYPKFSRSLLGRVSLIVMLHYAYPELIDIENLIEYDIGKLHLKNRDDDGVDNKPDAKRIMGIVSRLNYIYRKWEVVIYSFVKNGYFDSKYAERLFIDEEKRAERDEVNQRHRILWEQFHGSFVKTDGEIIKEHLEFIQDNCEILWIRDVYISLGLLGELGVSKAVLNQILDRAIRASARELDGGPVDSSLLRGMPEDIQEMLLAEINRTRPPVPLGEAMLRLGGEHGYSPSDIAHLLPYDVDDFYKWLTTEDRYDSILITKEVLGRLEADHKHGGRNVLVSLRAALDMLKKRSDVDRIRVERYVLS